MTNQTGSKGLHVIITVNEQFFGIPVDCIQEMAVMPKVTGVPSAPASVRGVVNLRGRVLPVIDLRIRLGIPSCLVERRQLIEMLEERKQDHLKWIKELKSAVEDNHPFKLAVDPHQCAFGQWYYSFNDSTQTAQCMKLSGEMRKLEDPHARIHAVAEKALALAAQGQHEEAMAVIHSTEETVLSALVKLFSEIKEVINTETREIALLINSDGRQAVAAVDSVVAVETINAEEDTSLVDIGLDSDDDLAALVGKRPSGDMVLLLNQERLLDEAAGLEI